MGARFLARGEDAFRLCDAERLPDRAAPDDGLDDLEFPPDLVLDAPVEVLERLVDVLLLEPRPAPLDFALDRLVVDRLRAVPDVERDFDAPVVLRRLPVAFVPPVRLVAVRPVRVADVLPRVVERRAPLVAGLRAEDDLVVPVRPDAGLRALLPPERPAVVVLRLLLEDERLLVPLPLPDEPLREFAAIVLLLVG